jgi:hypothetical protein
MTDADFWSLIDTSQSHAMGDCRQQERDLKVLLANLTIDEIAQFNVRYNNFIRDAYQWDLWGAAYIIGGGCSDDGFWDFRSWLVSRGRKVYRTALRNPESLSRFVSRTDPDRSWKSFLNPAAFVWAELTDRPMEECPGSASSLGETPRGKEWDEGELPKKFPKLWAEFGG